MLTLTLKIEIALWLLLAATWLVAALFAEKTVRRESLGSRLRYVLPAVAAGYLIGGRRLPIEWLNLHMIGRAPWVSVLSLGLTALGIGFSLWARLTLGRNWSGSVTLKKGHELIQTGPYAMTRHPIYTGFITAAIGTVLELGTVRAVLGVVIGCASLLMKMQVEERMMEEQFGDSYVEYRRRVRTLIPGLW